MNQNSLFYTCSLIESLSQTTGLQKSHVVDYLGQDGIQHIYDYADIFHCQSLEQSTYEIKELYHIPDANELSKTQTLEIWDSGEVYSRLIIDISEAVHWISKLIEVYKSWICEYIDDVSLPIYWQPRSYIKECYLQQKIL
ncbi:MAG: hypothetical protein LUH02_05655 [Erysipelotrichaceae bacterium]|nr:hypothetical protein [Erysipelotrichaceae bacterium]